MKYLLYIISSVALFWNSTFALTSESGATVVPRQKQALIGGWYSVFFDNYDQKKVNAIIKTIQEKRVRQIVVLYGQNARLANHIIASIQSKVNFTIERSHDVPKDTSTTKYNHTRVIVTVFLKKTVQAN